MIGWLRAIQSDWNNNWYMAHGVKDFQLEERLCGQRAERLKPSLINLEEL